MKHVFQIRFGKWASSNVSISVGKCANTGHLSSSGFSLCPNRYLSKITCSKPQHSPLHRRKSLSFYRVSPVYPQGYGGKQLFFFIYLNFEIGKEPQGSPTINKQGNKKVTKLMQKHFSFPTDSALLYKNYQPAHLFPSERIPLQLHQHSTNGLSNIWALQQARQVFLFKDTTTTWLSLASVSPSFQKGTCMQTYLQHKKILSTAKTLRLRNQAQKSSHSIC